VRRVGFRSGFLVGALLVFPFPLTWIPKLDSVARSLRWPLEQGARWVATDVLGLAAPFAGPNGSGDRGVDYAEVLLIAVLALVGTILWSIVDRRRRSYPRLAAAAWVVLRYYVASMMFSYGISKVLKLQFYDISPGILHQRIGDTPPMRLMWAFMGYSLPYTVFAGLAETVGGVLLLWRRTTTLGALLVIVVMTNVVVLNFCYDIPVKVFSTQLLVMAIAIALPSARRLLAVVMGRAAAEVPPRPRGTPRRERLRLVAKLALIGVITYDLYTSFSARPSYADHVHELYGNWIVDSFVADGVEHPPLTTDPVRWETWSASPRYMQIWLMDGTFEGRREMPLRGWYDVKVDAAAHTITVTVDYNTKRTENWTYQRPSPDHLVIDCVHGGRSLHVALHLEPDGLLVTRGYHWINEVPFNR
jgi:uncharacterized membrane protein YphA (DoxX/SURF4 family)